MFNYFFNKATIEDELYVQNNTSPSGTDECNKALTVSNVVTQALAFKASLTSAQQTTLQLTYTSTLGRKWSNLPCGSGCRNGIKFADLTTAQRTAALGVIQAASGNGANQGYDQFLQIRLSEEALQAQAGGTNYDENNYWIAFLNMPTTTGTWMLQWGGHHYAANIAFNGGTVVGVTPLMEGLEPATFTNSGTTYTPMAQKRNAMANMLAGLTAAQLVTAKLTTTFGDVLMSPGESNGNSNTFPSTKQGLVASAFTTAQKNLVISAMAQWINDSDADAASILMTEYNNDINNIYIAYTGAGTTGSASSFLTANTNYVRIDGTRVWIEFVCQNGVVFPALIHYHSVMRDHTHDYGTDLTKTSLGAACNLTVTSSANTGVGSLRDAVSCAATGSIIIIDPSVTTIALTSALTISGKTLTIKDGDVTPVIITLDSDVSNINVSTTGIAVLDNLYIKDLSILKAKSVVINDGTLTFKNTKISGDTGSRFSPIVQNLGVGILNYEGTSTISKQ